MRDADGEATAIGEPLQLNLPEARARTIAPARIGGDEDGALWGAPRNGFIKRTPLSEYPRKGRATGGVATMQLTPNTPLVAASVLSTGEDALLIAQSGRTARVTPNELPLVARDRKGTPGIKLDAPDQLSRLVVLSA